jgi:hypothetical protein
MVRASTDRLLLKVLGTMNEAQARWYVAREAIARGRGGITAMQKMTGMSRPTILRGIRELDERRRLGAPGRVRQPGGGRKRIEERHPRFEAALERIMDENTAGDPMSLLRWTHKSTGRMAEELTRQGHPTSDETVRRRLRDLDYSLQANSKTLEGRSPEGRDAQFRYINAQVKQFLRRHEPVLSVDTKKKERVGNFKNAGVSWRRKGQPRQVNVYDYPYWGLGTAIPYGALDVGGNEGFVNVGMSHDTAEFAVESLRRWWRLLGRKYYPNAKHILLSADGGGSNGSRNRAWKYYLQQFSDEFGLEVTTCHYPPGTSKWNKIEHRMFCHITQNWRGRPLTDRLAIVELIGASSTKTGLKIDCALDTRTYEKGIKIGDDEMATLNIEGDDFHPEWNYTIRPRRPDNS